MWWRRAGERRSGRTWWLGLFGLLGLLTTSCYDTRRVPEADEHPHPDASATANGVEPGDTPSVPDPPARADAPTSQPSDDGSAATLDSSPEGTKAEADSPPDPSDPATEPSEGPVETPPEAPPDEPAREIAPEPPASRRSVRVAFIGDQGMAPSARQVLGLIRTEGAQLVVHAGDLSYGADTPEAWIAQIDDALGEDFPYLVAIGNHDVAEWEGEQGFSALLVERARRTRSVLCYGDLGVAEVCRFRGVQLLLSGVGTFGSDHEAFLERALARTRRTPSVCVWHKNQHDMQAGLKIDEVGWDAYQICARYGAAIITGHEHSYARTMTLTAVGDHELGHGATGDPSRVRLAADSTFVAVSGLGGASTRARSLDHEQDSWWASIYANEYQLENGEQNGTDSAIDPGALFIDFRVDGDRRKAQAYFKTVTGLVADRFSITFAR